MRKPILGETIYSLNVGDRGGLTEAKVVKVGRKYFYVNCNGYETQYRLADWVENSDWAGSKLYETEQDYLDSKEAYDIVSFIHNHPLIRYGHGAFSITIDDLRAIKAILTKGEK